MKFYHGSDSLFEKFSNEMIGSKDSKDQYGSGIYFFDEEHKDNCKGYGKFRYEIDVQVRPDVEGLTLRHSYVDDYSFSAKLIKELLVRSPNLYSNLENTFDVNYEGIDQTLKSAVMMYRGINVLVGLNSIGNDFYPGEDCWKLLELYTKLSGWNSMLIEEHGILVMFRTIDCVINNIEIMR